MKKPFAKLFDVADIGQILVVAHRGDDGPELAITFRAPNDSILEIKIAFPDNDDGWEKLYLALDQVDESKAAGLAREQINEGPFAQLCSIGDEEVHHAR